MKELITASWNLECSAAISGTFKGRVSNFNQNQIIGLIAIIILILVCFANLNSYPQFSVPTLIVSFISFFFLVFGGFIRHCCIKAEDEGAGTSATIFGINKAIEIDNIPKSLLSKEFIEAVCSLRFFENEPPVGLIEGDVTDLKSIKMLNEEERIKLKEEEHKAILEHQEKIKEEIKKLQVLPSPPKQTP